MKKRVKQFIKHALWRTVPQLSRRWWIRPAPQEFCIGIYTGVSPFCLVSAKHVSNPVLTRNSVTDVPAVCVADPFMCRAGNLWYMFFEVVNQITLKGEIGLAISENGMQWKYQQIVLAEPFHLSYPYVFEWQNEYYMIPEGGRGDGVSLYKSANFPVQWSRIATLLKGERFVDSSIFRYHDRWWLLTDTGGEAKSPVLRLYFAEELTGPWFEHPDNPLLEENPHVCRPSGRVLILNDKPIRFAQDVFPIYGSKVSAFEIVEITVNTYEERQIGTECVLTSGDDNWNSGGMHHIDAHLLSDRTWMACVDGFRFHDSISSR